MVLATGLPAEAAGRRSSVYIGSYTPAGPGLQVGSADPRTGSLTITNTVGGIANPSWFAFSCDRRRFYSTNENDPDGAVTAFSISDPAHPRVLNSKLVNG